MSKQKKLYEIIKTLHQRMCGFDGLQIVPDRLYNGDGFHCFLPTGQFFQISIIDLLQDSGFGNGELDAPQVYRFNGDFMGFPSISITEAISSATEFL